MLRLLYLRHDNKYKPLKGIGHFAAVENPGVVSQVVGEFLHSLE